MREAGVGMSGEEEEKRLLGGYAGGSRPWVPQLRCRGEKGARAACFSEGRVIRDAASGERRSLGCDVVLGGSVPSGTLTGSCGMYGQGPGGSDPLGWAKPLLLVLEVSRGMHRGPAPTAKAVGRYWGGTHSPRGPRPAQHQATPCLDLASQTHLSHSQGRQDPSASVCPTRHPHISSEAVHQPVPAPWPTAWKPR